MEGEQLAALIRSVQTAPSPAPTSRSAGSSAVGGPSRPVSTERHGPAPSVQKRCPQCGHPMVLRTAQRGPQVGQQFWGCSQFPRCRGTLPVAKQV